MNDKIPEEEQVQIVRRVAHEFLCQLLAPNTPVVSVYLTLTWLRERIK